MFLLLYIATTFAIYRLKNKTFWKYFMIVLTDVDRLQNKVKIPNSFQVYLLKYKSFQLLTRFFSTTSLFFRSCKI